MHTIFSQEWLAYILPINIPHLEWLMGLPPPILFLLVIATLFVLLSIANGINAARAKISDPLLVAVLGDKATAERLCRYELERTPGISRKMARRRALERLIADRNR